MNKGKMFEEDFKKSFEGTEQLVSIDRLLDPMGGARGVSNICDFIVYKFPCIFYLELKSLEGNALNFKSAISAKQLKGLTDKTITDGAIPGFIVNYRDHEETYFVHVSTIMRLIKMEFKSLNIVYAREHGVRLYHKKKVTRYSYNVVDLIYRLVDEYGRQ